MSISHDTKLQITFSKVTDLRPQWRLSFRSLPGAALIVPEGASIEDAMQILWQMTTELEMYRNEQKGDAQRIRKGGC